MSSEACDTFSQEISAFLDGELAFPDCLPALDHLAACDGCRTFYASSRRLSERVLSGPAESAPDRLWSGITSRAGAGRPVSFPGKRRLYALGIAAAATLVVAVALSDRSSPGPPSVVAARSAPSALKEIVVEGARGRMTDERFVSLLSEILSADQKYHRETERVLKVVLDREVSAETEEPDTSEQSENLDSEAQPRPEAPKAPARPAPPLQS